METNNLEYDYKLSSYLAYKHAKDFNNSARIIDDNNLPKVVLVNIAFACELYLKALLIWNNKSDEIIRCHRLRELFEKLDKEIQKTIKTNSEIVFWDGFLNCSSDAFNNWRYFYEKDNVLVGHIGAFFSLADVLDQLCVETISVKEVFESVEKH